MKRLIFWKYFLYVFVLFYTIELSYIFAFDHGDSLAVFIPMFVSVATSSNLFLLAFASSFVVTHSIRKRLMSENPKKVFTIGLLKLGLFFFVVQLFLGLVTLFIAGAPSFNYGLFMFWVVPMLVFLIWIYASTFLLYKLHEKEKRI